MITSNNKVAILSMDIEDWYHLDYFKGLKCNQKYSLLDGVSNYLQILEDEHVPSSFFVLGEIANSIKHTLKEIIELNHEIGSHGWNHNRPIMMSEIDFKNDLIKSKENIQNLTGSPVEGYRASCFSLNRKLLNQVIDSGFKYDSSRINFGSHPLYETLDMKNFRIIRPNIYSFDDFFEFEVSTYSYFNKNIPVSGGGYLRILPWYISKHLIQSYLNKEQLYIFYIHPFELSKNNDPEFPVNTSLAKKIRFKTGRRTVAKKLLDLISLLKENGYRFETFKSLKSTLI